MFGNKIEEKRKESTANKSKQSKAKQHKTKT
jgi:hypothetical protein